MRGEREKEREREREKGKEVTQVVRQAIKFPVGIDRASAAVWRLAGRAGDKFATVFRDFATDRMQNANVEQNRTWPSATP